jgi:hypothetical protein
MEGAHAWTQNWLPRDDRIRPVAPRKDDALSGVSDYIATTPTSWNKAKLEKSFYPMDTEVRKNIPVCNRVQQDFCSWHFGRTWFVLVRPCYLDLVTTRRLAGFTRTG